MVALWATVEVFSSPARARHTSSWYRPFGPALCWPVSGSFNQLFIFLRYVLYSRLPEER